MPIICLCIYGGETHALSLSDLPNNHIRYELLSHFKDEENEVKIDDPGLH